ncbi:MAG: ABC transporter permease subunit [Calothrix sp. SM1_5_4]|nr:ABC transporter permease subunit [Calothrix sp. SM1_5_4]
MIQLFLIFYGLPHVGLQFDPFMAAVIGLGLNYGACEAENYRAGILSIPAAQMDASQALGMTRAQSLRHTRFASGGEGGDPARDQRFHRLAQGLVAGVRDHDG